MKSVLKAFDIATEAIKAVDVADQLKYEKINDSQSSQK